MPTCIYKSGDVIAEKYIVTQGFRDGAGGAWGFAKRANSTGEYFIKRFKYPVHPGGVVTDQRKVQSWDRFFQRMARMDKALAKCGVGGIIVRTVDFFDFGNNAGKGKHWFKVCLKIEPSLQSNNVHTLPHHHKLLVLQTAAHGIAKLHDQGIVHLDIKPDNLMRTDHQNGGDRCLVCKIIDFDDSIFEGEEPDHKELVGDTAWYSPEMGLYALTDGESPLPGRASDVFSLGLVFCQFWFGAAPISRYSYPYEAALKNEPLVIPAEPLIGDTVNVFYPAKAAALDRKIAALIQSMTALNSGDRPSMHAISQQLMALGNNPPDVFEHEETPKLKRMRR